MSTNKKKVNQEIKQTKKSLPANVIKQIKEEIRAWYGCLSIKEIINNKKLMAEIKSLEQLLSSQVVIV